MTDRCDFRERVINLIIFLAVLYGFICLGYVTWKNSGDRRPAQPVKEEVEMKVDDALREIISQNEIILRKIEEIKQLLDTK